VNASSSGSSTTQCGRTCSSEERRAGRPSSSSCCVGTQRRCLQQLAFYSVCIGVCAALSLPLVLLTQTEPSHTDWLSDGKRHCPRQPPVVRRLQRAGASVPPGWLRCSCRFRNNPQKGAKSVLWRQSAKRVSSPAEVQFGEDSASVS
jgi:hypothetical protein